MRQVHTPRGASSGRAEYACGREETILNGRTVPWGWSPGARTALCAPHLSIGGKRLVAATGAERVVTLRPAEETHVHAIGAAATENVATLVVATAAGIAALELANAASGTNAEKRVTCTSLEFRYLGSRVQRIICQHIGRAFPEMERHEQPSFLYVIRNPCRRGNLSTPSGYFDFLAVIDIESAGVIGMYLYIAGGRDLIDDG